MVDVATALRGINAACNDPQSRPVATRKGWQWVAEAQKDKKYARFTGFTLWRSESCCPALSLASFAPRPRARWTSAEPSN